MDIEARRYHLSLLIDEANRYEYKTEGWTHEGRPPKPQEIDDPFSVPAEEIDDRISEWDTYLTALLQYVDSVIRERMKQPPEFHELVLGQDGTLQAQPIPFGQAWIQTIPPMTIGAALAKLYRNAFGPTPSAEIDVEIAAIDRACLTLQRILDRYHQDIKSLEERISRLESGE